MLVCHTALYRSAVFTVRVASVVATLGLGGGRIIRHVDGGGELIFFSTIDNPGFYTIFISLKLTVLTLVNAYSTLVRGGPNFWCICVGGNEKIVRFALGGTKKIDAFTRLICRRPPPHRS